MVFCSTLLEDELDELETESESLPSSVLESDETDRLRSVLTVSGGKLRTLVGRSGDSSSDSVSLSVKVTGFFSSFFVLIALSLLPSIMLMGCSVGRFFAYRWVYQGWVDNGDGPFWSNF